eukprot:CCRYP_000471-RA/>CCRYP_000471-RA protein AED:0.60 eAED:0.60 QI:0/0/0/0.66/1/1/3/0/84
MYKCSCIFMLLKFNHCKRKTPVTSRTLRKASECTGRLPNFKSVRARHGTAKLSPQTEFGIRLAPPCCRQRFAEACKFLCLVSIK